MVNWLFWRRDPEPDYETLLSGLETSIKSRESRLLSIRLRERRANVLFITYGLGAWVVYVLLWYLGVVGGRAGVEKLFGVLPVIGGPVGIIFTRRIMRYWFSRQKNKEENTLRTLKKQQRDKVEELKRKTGYYSTRNLLEKYDDSTKKSAEARPPQPRSQPSAPSTPSRANPNPPRAPGPPQTPLGTPRVGQSQQPLPLLPPAPSTPAPRTVFDKLADALLGVAGDESSPNNKYALICGKCYAHNGLVLKEEFDTIQYQCPRCGHLNPRRKPLPTAVDSLKRPSSAASHRRGVRSMHVTASQRDESDEDPGEGFDKEEPKGYAVDEGEPEGVAMVDKNSVGERLRQRKATGAAEAMDIDET